MCTYVCMCSCVHVWAYNAQLCCGIITVNPLPCSEDSALKAFLRCTLTIEALCAATSGTFTLSLN